MIHKGGEKNGHCPVEIREGIKERFESTMQPVNN